MMTIPAEAPRTFSYRNRSRPITKAGAALLETGAWTRVTIRPPPPPICHQPPSELEGPMTVRQWCAVAAVAACTAAVLIMYLGMRGTPLP